MQLEFHQLDRRWEHLRVRHPAQQRRLMASLAEAGQQTPIAAVVAEGHPDRYVVIDGYKRVAALEQLGRDTVEAVIWPMSEACPDKTSRGYVCVAAVLPDGISMIHAKDLHRNPALKDLSTEQLGDWWRDSRPSAVLQVPSFVIAGEH